jgi:hypothetical protein
LFIHRHFFTVTSDSRHFPAVEVLIDQAIPSQLSALSSFHLFVSESDQFRYESTLLLSNGLKVISGDYLGSESLFLPLFHGFPSTAQVLSEFLDLRGNRRTFLALCAADSSVILYEISDFQFPAAAGS